MLRKALFLAAAVALIFALSITALAAGTGVTYYDANGNQVYGSGMYYGQNNCLYFGEGCYYIDSDGNNVYVGGCRAYYYDRNGNLAAGGYGAQGNQRYSNGGSYRGCCNGW